PWSRRTLGSVRARVEAAERQEQGETDAAGEDGTGTGRGAAAERSALLERIARRNPPTTATSPAPNSATGAFAGGAPSASADSAAEPDEPEDDDRGRALRTVAAQESPDEAATGEEDGQDAPADPAARRTCLPRRRDR